MTRLENLSIEYKRAYSADIRKEVVAFANTEGGKIYIGVEDDGMVCGVTDADDIMLKVAGSLKDSIAPDVMPFIMIQTIVVEEKQVVEITVSPGVNRPYYIREKGLKPSGVYVRKGSSSQPVTDEGIRQMIVQYYSQSFEACRSMQQDLTFCALQKLFHSKGIELGSSQMKTLKLLGEDGLYTNLALLLSEQCPFTTKVAVFQGKDNSVFRDRKEFQGSILSQMDEVYQYIDFYNRTKATFSGLNRVDYRDYPEEALREAWMNCIVHRDYSFSGSTIINICENRIEFVSLGGLVPGVELSSIRLGISQSRNPGLAALFYRTHLIESYGTGLGKIVHSYSDFDLQPNFETAMGAFRVTLPNRNEEQKCNVKYSEKKECIGPSSKVKTCVEEFIQLYGSITRQETENLLQVSSAKSSRVLKEMCESGVISRVGNGSKVKYILRA